MRARPVGADVAHPRINTFGSARAGGSLKPIGDFIDHLRYLPGQDRVVEFLRASATWRCRRSRSAGSSKAPDLRRQFLGILWILRPFKIDEHLRIQNAGGFPHPAGQDVPAGGQVERQFARGPHLPHPIVGLGGQTDVDQAEPMRQLLVGDAAQKQDSIRDAVFRHRARRMGRPEPSPMRTPLTERSFRRRISSIRSQP